MAENARGGEKGGFVEDDARVGAMHGYGAVTQVVTVSYPTREDVLRLEGKVDGLETLVRGLIVALRSGAVGRWS